MCRISCCAALAVLAAAVAFCGAYARTNPHGAAALAGAHNSASDMDIRKQCFAEAKERYPSTSQDMQTNRYFAYTTCAVSHGMRYP